LTARQPVGFVAHGSPTLAIDVEKGRPLCAWAERVARPSSLLVVSAHWEESPLTLGAVEQPETVYDFSGFPPELYELRYAAPGDPHLAEAVLDLLQGRAVRRSERGIDHGVWVPLLHMFPERDVPVLQLSMPRAMGPDELFAVGEALELSSGA
jgi:4,5-DOPA dioxygenase extradiol